MCYDSSIEV